MGKPGAYLNIRRREHGMRAAAEAVADFEDIVVDLSVDAQREQASRCMNCGVPFCQSGLAFNGGRRATGCPLHNLIPETNDSSSPAGCVPHHARPRATWGSTTRP